MGIPAPGWVRVSVIYERAFYMVLLRRWRPGYAHGSEDARFMPAGITYQIGDVESAARWRCW